MCNNEQNKRALHYIAGYLNSSGIESFDDVDGALEELINTAKATQSQYRNGTAEKAKLN
jgi:hypothetical protein